MKIKTKDQKIKSLKVKLRKEKKHSKELLAYAKEALSLARMFSKQLDKRKILNDRISRL